MRFRPNVPRISIVLLFLLGGVNKIVHAFTVLVPSQSNYYSRINNFPPGLASSSSSNVDVNVPTQPAPSLDGKRVLPYKIMKMGLKGHTLPAVYVLLNKEYKRGEDGWSRGEYVGVTQDLDLALKKHVETLGAEKVAHVRALSFSHPEPTAMEEVASQWRRLVKEAGGSVIDPKDYLFDLDDEDEDDMLDEDEYFDMEVAAAASAAVMDPNLVVSPFGDGTSSISSTEDDDDDDNNNDDEEETADTTGTEIAEGLPFTMENIDKVLDEVRPYLISDGGNVALAKIDEEKKDVYLILEGACGSCASSTVTMQMGIERVLKENYPDLGEVIQLEDESNKVTELTLEAVQEEFNRMYPAILAMGGVARIVGVDPEFGVVRMTFRGASKVQQGLELALLDVPFANKVEFLPEQ